MISAQFLTVRSAICDFQSADRPVPRRFQPSERPYFAKKSPFARLRPTIVPEGQKPAQESCIACLLNTRDHNLLRAKHFHVVSFENGHEHMLKSRYGKVRLKRKSYRSDSPKNHGAAQLPELQRLSEIHHQKCARALKRPNPWR